MIWAATPFAMDATSYSVNPILNNNGQILLIKPQYVVDKNKKTAVALSQALSLLS